MKNIFETIDLNGNKKIDSDEMKISLMIINNNITGLNLSNQEYEWWSNILNKEENKMGER